nr:hypothetical protein [Tanacetum cinerariifolium]
MEEEFARENQRSREFKKGEDLSHFKPELSQEQQFKGSKGVSEEELKGMMQLVPLEEVYIEALQVKHPIIDWEIHTEGKREYWKIIRLGGHTGAYQFFVDMLKQFDREDLHQLWILVKETFSIKQCTRDKERELWEIFMLVEKDYPLRKGLATMMIIQDEELFEASSPVGVLVEVHGVNYDVDVHELGTWNKNVIDETLDSSKSLDVNGMEKEDDINKVSLKLAVFSDLGRPLGFEHTKRTTSKCSTSFDRYRKKYIKRVSLIKELSRIIEVGDSLGFDVRGMARGKSGCLISMWDPRSFIKDDRWCDDTFIIAKGYWRNMIGDYYMINIYGLQDSLAKAILWNRIGDFMHQHVDNSGLIDLPLGGHLFTWMNKDGTKLSKFDRFLISKEVSEALPDVRVTSIDRLWSDHNLILLHIYKSDFGSTPFKLLHSWLFRDSFVKVIKTEIPKLEEHNFERKLLSHEKFCLLNARIKQWNSETKTFDRVTKHDNLQLIKSIEEKNKAGSTNDDDQKKRRAQMIHGIMKEGVWILNPSQINKELLNFFKEKFKNHDSNVDFPPSTISSGLCALDRDILETLISLDEAKNAVWDCSSSKAPNPDGFFFALVKNYWDDIKVNILEHVNIFLILYVNIFLDIGLLPHGSNSSFFTLIPKASQGVDKIVSHEQSAFIAGHQILDGPFILSEIVEWLAKVIDKIVSHEQSAFIAGRQILDDPLILKGVGRPTGGRVVAVTAPPRLQELPKNLYAKKEEDDGVVNDDYEEAPIFDDDQYEDVIEEEGGFVGKGFVDNYLNFQEDENNVSFSSVVLGVEIEPMPVYDTDIEDVIEEKEGFVGK